MVQNYLFGPKKAEILVKMTRNLFHRFSRTKAIKNDGSYDENRHILIFDPFWDRKAQILENRIFRAKSGSVSFLQFWSPNFMPKISKILGAVFQKKINLCHFWVIFGYFGPFWDR